MRERTFVVHGVVTDAVHGKGIHGINVRLTDKKRLLDKLGASTLCHSDGRFTLRFDRKSQAILFRTKPTFRVQFFDRDGVLLHEEPARVRFAAASNMSIKVAIPNLKIANHLSRPLTLQQRSGRLVPDGRVGIFAHAFARLPNLASARYANFLSDRPCPFPPLDRFDDLLEDIWGTLGGDPFARDRFEDVIDVFAAGNLPRRESISTTARDLRVTARAGADSRKTLDRLIVELKATAPMWAPAEALLGRDALVPLMLATAWTFGADGQRLDSSLRTVLGQLAAYRPLAALLSAAEQSLGGGQKSERHLQAIMGTLDELCGFEAGLPPPFEGLLIDPSDLGALEHWGCTAEAAMAIRFLRDRVGFPPRPGTSTETYRIDSMSPSPVCGGDEITLTGEGFTGVPGLVRFAGERARRRMPIGVEAISWSDTEIRVTIPPEAACGPIELRIVEDRVTR